MNNEILSAIYNLLTAKKHYVETIASTKKYFASLKGKCFLFKNRKYKILSVEFPELYVLNGNVYYVEVNEDGTDKHNSFTKILFIKKMNNLKFFNELIENNIVVGQGSGHNSQVLKTCLL